VIVDSTAHVQFQTNQVVMSGTKRHLTCTLPRESVKWTLKPASKDTPTEQLLSNGSTLKKSYVDDSNYKLDVGERGWSATLTILNTTSKDAGLYVCTGFNTTAHDAVQLIVLGKDVLNRNVKKMRIV